MNWAYKLFWTSVLAASVSMMMAGCSKKDNEMGVRGNAVSDGQSVHSQSLVNGIDTSVGITNITLMTNGMNTAFNGNGYNPYMNPYSNPYMANSANIPVTFQLVVNGQTKLVNTYSQGYNGFHGQDILGGQTITYDSRCGDWACNTFYLGVTVGSQTGGELKQIGVMKIMTENKIVAVFEQQGLSSSALQMDVLVQQLNAIYTAK